MKHRIGVGSAITVSILLVAGMSLRLPSTAEARGPRGYRGGFVGGGFGWGPWFGPYSYYGPYGYGPYAAPGGVSFGVAMMAGFGAVDMNVKPNQAEVWVDGKYVAEARDLDGYPSYLWLKQGPHHVVVYKGGYRRFEEDVDVRAGMKADLKVRLERGESEPPRRLAADATPRLEARRDEKGEIRLKLRPGDASVYVDGEFRGPAQELRNLTLPPGHHRIEASRPGFRTLDRDVVVEAGRSSDLDLELERP